jgi:hypothetical protein
VGVPAIYVLLGLPGTGKLTVGTALRDELEGRGHTTKLLDNHRTANILFDLVPEADGSSQLPAAVFPLIRQMNLAVLRAVDELAPHGWSFVLTHHLPASADPSYLGEIARVSARRGARFVPVVLSCDLAELHRRIGRPDRVANMKLTDPARIPEMVEGGVLVPEGALHLDVTSVPPEEAARTIVAHAWGDPA